MPPKNDFCTPRFRNVDASVPTIEYFSEGVEGRDVALVELRLVNAMAKTMYQTEYPLEMRLMICTWKLVSVSTASTA